MVPALLCERRRPVDFIVAGEEGQMDERNPKNDNIETDDSTMNDEDIVGRADDDDEEFEDVDDLEDEEESVEEGE